MEVRRLHIVYFLSRNGRIEHPHLIRVHHLSRNGVHLRDVKRWLAELRGKDFPESFAWSYKRRFKTGYVWQDLLDDNLITPISDNEYVLKGSEISPSTFNKEILFGDQKKVLIKNRASGLEEEVEDKKASETSTDVSRKSSFDIEEESITFGSDASPLTDNSGKVLEVEEKHLYTENKQEELTHIKQIPSIEMDKKRRTKVKIASSIKASETCFAKGKSCSSGGSHKIRNLITCGALDTNDSAVVMINLRDKPVLNMCSGSSNNAHSTELCIGEKHGGSQRIFGTTWNQHWNTSRKSCDGVKDSMKKTGEFSSQRTSRTGYKPINGPNCSQCGKQFKPEKLHAHMKSCKGIKALGKRGSSVNPANSTSQRSIQFLASP